MTPTGLRRNQTLNPLVWDAGGEKLKPDVRTHILNVGEAWREFAKIPKGAVMDVLLVGGNAGYFYAESSDLDVHLLVRRSMVPAGELTDEYLADKKAMWTSRYDVRIKGLPVEPYAQDVSDPFAAGQGVYSVERQIWLQKPTTVEYDPNTDPILATRVRHWKKKIDTVLADPNSDLDSLKDSMRIMRSKAISRGGELARDNLVFKSLRAAGYLDMMSNASRDRKVAGLTLEGRER